MFALPDGSGDYRLRVDCEDAPKNETATCFANRAFNDYIAVRYIFDGSLLCNIEDGIDAHLDLLRQSVVDEQTTKNDKWRNR